MAKALGNIAFWMIGAPYCALTWYWMGKDILGAIEWVSALVW